MPPGRETRPDDVMKGLRRPTRGIGRVAMTLWHDVVETINSDERTTALKATGASGLTQQEGEDF